MAAPMAKLSSDFLKNIQLLSCNHSRYALLKHGFLSVNTCRTIANERTSTNRAIPEEVQQWKKLDWKSYAKGNLRVPVAEDSNYPALLIPGHSPLPFKLEKRKKAQRKPKKRKPPRFLSMMPDQDWTNVWPSAQTFKWSAVPFPVRQAYIRRQENDGIPLGKYANVELMKIPNFLHLTPAHVRKQCAAIKKFCTQWPTGLESDEACERHFPVEVVMRDYVVDTVNLREPRARLITLKVKVSRLDLDEHARDKLLKLVGYRYDTNTDILTLETDRCPLKKQNYDYTIYLLTALYNESWKIEPWEREQTEEDMIKYEWNVTAAKSALVNTVTRMKDAQQKSEAKMPKSVAVLQDVAEIDDLEVTKQYRAALIKLYEEGEDLHSQDQYKSATKKLLLGMS